MLAAVRAERFFQAGMRARPLIVAVPFQAQLRAAATCSGISPLLSPTLIKLGAK